MGENPLPPLYYLEHFCSVLRLLRERDQDLLLPPESGFIHAFFQLPYRAQALVARIASRGPAVLRKSSLQYPELSDTHGLLEMLEASGWITQDPVVSMTELFAALPLSFLASGFGLKPNRALNKRRMLGQAQEIYPGSVLLSRTHFRPQEPLFHFLPAPLYRRLCAQYFGNYRQDWSQSLIAQLGIRRFESVTLEARSRPFQYREEIEVFHALQECADLLDDEARVTDVRAVLPQAPTSCDWLLERHRRIAIRLARRMEREGEITSALDLYRSIGTPEAADRVRVVSRKLTGARALLRTGGRAVDDIQLSLPPGGDRKSEQWVAQVLAQTDPSCEVQVVENRLFNALFGLLFWRALFAPVRGAFFHAFQSAPADLHSNQFSQRRRAQIDECLEKLRTDTYQEAMRLTLTTKTGISNPWIGWRWLRPSILEPALQYIPAQDLRVVFQWMLADLRCNTSGFPDLVQYWPRERRYCLVEVKLGADRLKDNQRRFLQHANDCGLPVRVCYATGPTSCAKPRKLSSPERASRPFSLFAAAPVNPARSR